MAPPTPGFRGYVQPLYVQHPLLQPLHLDSCHLRRRMFTRCRMCMTYDVVGATYDIVLHIVYTMSYVRHDIRYRMYDIVYIYDVVCVTYDIVCDTYDIVCFHFHISYTMSYVGNVHTMSYVHDIRYRRFISYTTSYVHTMSHVNIRYRMSHIQCRMSHRGGSFRCFKGTRSPAHCTGEWVVPFLQQELHF